MTTAIKRRRGTTAQHSTFTGLEGELTIDTTKDTVVVHDGATAGGVPLLREDLSNNTSVLTTSAIGSTVQAYDADLTTLGAGGSSARSFLGLAIGTDVQAYDADTAKLDVSQSWSAAQAFNAGVTLGDASGDALTINSSAVSIPNGLNFDSNTLVIDATNNVVGIGGSTASSVGLNVASANLVSTVQSGVRSTPTFNSASTAFSLSFYSLPATAAASFTTDVLAGFYAANANKGTDSIITNQHGVYIADQTRGTNNYGVTSAVSSGSNKFNIYASGTANNYFAGNVGIGTASPAAKLHLQSNGANVNFTFTRDDGSGQYGGQIIGTDGATTPAIRFNTISAGAGTERMRITSSGNVGIGTSSPTSKLHVYGDGSVYSQTESSGSGNVGIRFKNTARDWYLFTGSSGSASFYDGTADATRLTIDTSGNLGLGVTPSAWGSAWKALQVEQTSISTLDQYESNYSLNAYNDNSGWRYQTTEAATQYRQGSGAHKWYNAPSGTAGNAITFTQAMTLDASGNLGIGTTSPGTKLNVTGGAIRNVNANGILEFANGNTAGGAKIAAYNAALTANGYLAFEGYSIEYGRFDSSGNLLVGTTASTASRIHILSYEGSNGCMSQRVWADGQYATWFLNAAGSNVGNITVNTSSTSYNTSSDYRLKENIAPMTGALATVQALKPCTYTWKADGSDGQGFIAHELAEVVPECVTGEKDAVDAEGNPVYQGIDTSFLVATLTAAIQEQQAIITDLKARIETLESK